jgi:cell division protein FtsB
MARGSRSRKPQRRSHGAKTTGASWLKGTAGRARLAFLGAIVASAVILFAWFPAGSILAQRSTLHGTQAELNALHAQDSALAQESKNLSDPGEIGRIARQQYQLVSPGQQSYEVLPPSGATAAGTPYAGDPGSDGPVTPSATPELPPGGVTTTTTTTPVSSQQHAGAAQSHSTPTSSGGFGSRVLHSLEFWR